MEKKEKANEDKIEIIGNDYGETLVVIDGDFLGACIRNDQRFYKRVFPDRMLERIELAGLCQEILANARALDADRTFKFVIFHSQANRGFPFMKEAFKDIGGKGLTTDKLSVEFYTVEAETEERLLLRINGFLKSLVQDTDAHSERASVIKKVIFCGDHPIYSQVMHALQRRGKKEIVSIRKTIESKMDVSGVDTININYLVGRVLGLGFDRPYPPVTGSGFPVSSVHDHKEGV